MSGLKGIKDNITVLTEDSMQTRNKNLFLWPRDGLRVFNTWLCIFSQYSAAAN